jgi:AcrR family transcriptional regulator
MRKLLQTALIELTEEEGFDRVTVGRLTERAMVSRASFYRHYRDKFDLVEQIFDDAVNALIGTMTADDEPVTERLVAFFEHIARHDRMYGALLGRTGSQWFANRMRATMAEIVVRHLVDEPIGSNGHRGAAVGRPAGALMPTLLASLYVQTVTWWLENDQQTSPRELAEQFAQIASAVIAASGKRSLSGR